MISEHRPIRELWRHEDPLSSQLEQFRKDVGKMYGVHVETYDELHLWSIHNLSDFWSEVWRFTGVRASQQYTAVVEKDAPMWPRPTWFSGALFNYAENLLYPPTSPKPKSIAVVSANELGSFTVTWAELREKVRHASNAMRKLRVVKGDRVGLIAGNTLEALVVLLATSALGAIMCASSPDLGVSALLERLKDLDPKILFADNGVIYNGKTHASSGKLHDVVQLLPSLRTCIMINSVPTALAPLDIIPLHGTSLSYEDFINPSNDEEQLFEQLPFDHPLFLLYSSGTTGKAKVIVHGQGGTLIQLKKEHQIHGDIGLGDVFFQVTQINWMMWPWLVTGLASGATIVLYDGSPFMPKDLGGYALWQLADEYNVKVFGTSAKYLSTLEQNDVIPVTRYSLDHLRSIYSTGSVLAASTFEYIYRAFPKRVAIQSITGGTDIISLFAAPNALLPIHTTECQCKGLGMAITVFDDAGNNVEESGQSGDLVCTAPFPSMPVTFWGNDGPEKYRRAYFERFPGIWHHGDYLRINPQTHGITMLGRSDGILNPSGVRFGSAEIYGIMLQFFSTQVDDSVCVGRRRPTDVDETVVLFVKMAPGYNFSAEFVKAIKGKIRSELSPRHVPGIVAETKDIPHTINHKKIETVVKQIISGTNVTPSTSVANPESIPFFVAWAQEN